jgi:hypothetical protein
MINKIYIQKNLALKFFTRNSLHKFSIEQIENFPKCTQEYLNKLGSQLKEMVQW